MVEGARFKSHGYQPLDRPVARIERRSENPRGRHLAETGAPIQVPVSRFDQLPIAFDKPAILKIDAETHTFKALKGFGSRINEFRVVTVEMWNCYPEYDWFNNQQADIWEFMLANGFRMARAIDAEYAIGRIPVYDLAFWKP